MLIGRSQSGRGLSFAEWPESRGDVGQAEIVADVEQRRGSLLGERIGEAIAKIEPASSGESLAEG